MRQLLPTPVDPMAAYGDLPVATGRPAVRLNMIASVDGATTLDGVSGGLGGRVDHALFAVLCSLAEVVLVAAGTVRAEHYGPSSTPIAVVSRSLRLDWDAPFFTSQLARPLVVTVANAPPDQLAKAAAVADIVIAGDRTSIWRQPWPRSAVAASRPCWPRAAPPSTGSWQPPACSTSSA